MLHVTKMLKPSPAEQEHNMDTLPKLPSILPFEELSGDSQSSLAPLAALANQDILEHLVKFLAFEDVQKCRLVNHLWNNACSKEVGRRSKAINIGSANFAKRKQAPDQMRRLINVIDKSWNFPVSKFVVYDCITQGQLENERLLCTLFENIAPFITELRLDDSLDPSEQHFQHCLPLNVEYPCLTSLTVMFMTGLEAIFKGHYNNLEFVASILKNSPNLKELHYSDLITSEAAIKTVFINAMAQAGLQNLRYLHLGGDLHDEHLKKVQEMGLKLKRLKLKFKCNATISTECLKTFLESLNDRLEELHLFTYTFQGSFQLQFPCMTKLQELGICLYFTCIDNPATKGVTFPGISSHQFPVLKRVDFSYESLQNLEQHFHSGMKPDKTVQELRLPFKFEDSSIILHSSRIFPKLRKLEIPAQKEIVNAVFEFCETVEELLLNFVNERYEPTLDELLTGYSKEEYERITKRKLTEKEMEAIDLVPVPFLQRLKILRLQDIFNKPFFLSDIGCGLVLLKFEALKCLDFNRAFRSTIRISGSMMEKMRKKFQVINCGGI